MRKNLSAALALLLVNSLTAQERPALRFEAASVKDAGSFVDASSGYMKGGPGTSDPGRIMWRQPVSRLISVAYGVEFDRILGPKWLATENYEIMATIPEGSTREQVMAMWRDLLRGRFGLKAHIVRRDFPAYELIVPENGRPKLRESSGGSYVSEPGFPVLAAQKKFGVLVAPPRNVRQSFRATTMAELARLLAWPLGTIADTGGLTPGRVLDKTGLAGIYDFTLEFAGAWGPGGVFLPNLPEGEVDTAPDMFGAVRQQLGLQLREVKTLLDVVVVDEIARVPSEN